MNEVMKTYRWIDVLSSKIWNINFKATRSVLRESDFIGRRTPCHIDSISLAHDGNECAGVSEHPSPVICDTRCVDIEAS